MNSKNLCLSFKSLQVFFMRMALNVVLLSSLSMSIVVSAQTQESALSIERHTEESLQKGFKGLRPYNAVN